MFLAPLNYDRFFKKVFSDTNIAKAFLEDFLDVTIEEIDKLENTKRISDDASTVEFDFRCKISGAYVIIDMQQWYKRDIGKRFYLYHAVNTGLQLEKLPEKKIPIETLTGQRTKDYSGLEPVITLVWMSADTLDFKENYIAYTMAPEIVSEFIRNEELWRNRDILQIMKERMRVLELMNNKKKDLDFFAQNRLIFAFQANIVRNKTHARYEKWFTFAERSRNEENKESDFEEYKNDVVFKEIIHRLNKGKLKTDDMEYIEREKEYWLDWLRFDRSSYDEGKEEGKSEEKRNIARNLKQKNMSIDAISDVTGLSIEEIREL
jgi:predicted transposase YdaD